MTTTDLTVPEIEPLERDHAALLNEARSVVDIPDASTYERAAICKRGLVARRIFIGDFFKPIKQSIDAAKRVVLDRERLVLTPVQEQEARISALLVSYDDEQERRRQLDERRAQEEAQLAEASHHEALGDHASAEAALDGRGLLNVSVPSSTPKVAGISYRENWGAEVTDKLALIKAVAEGKAPMAYVEPNYTVLNQAARAIKQDLGRIPGVKSVMTRTAVGRR